MLSAAQLAFRLQVPVPLFMVTVLPEMEQTPVAARVAVVLALVVAGTGKVDLEAALAGAPVKVTVGAVFVAAVDCVAEAAR